MSNDWHVEPIGGLIEHDTSLDSRCVCKPTKRLVDESDPSRGAVFTHHSLDGREHRESNHDRTACGYCSSIDHGQVAA